MGFLGLTYSGKDLLVDLLTGKIAEGNGKKDIYLGGIQVKDWKELKGYIYRIHVENYQIDDWTVAEYLGLVESGGWGGLLRRGRLEEEAQRDFQELDLDFDVSCKIKHLTELEKRILDLAKAYRRGARIVVIEDEFDGMSRKDIEIFARSMHRIIVGRMGVIVSSHSNLILSLLSDKYIIFRKGRIVKKCQRDYIKSEEQNSTLEQAAATNPTAILLDPVDYDGSADIIKEIQDRDIPVILFDAPSPEGSGLTSVGNDFSEQATIAVEMLVEEMGTSGKVAVMQGAPTAPNHAERYQAHLDALAKYPDIEVIDGGIDNDNVETAQSQAAAVLAANPDLTGYLNCDACGSGVAAAIEEKGMQDKVTFVAMDNLIEILDYVKSGTITATSSTLPQEQGMYAVLMAYQAAQGMALPANVDTGIGRITADNVDEWIEIVSGK